MKTVEVHEIKPEKFSPRVEVAACYVESDERLLLLLNAPGDAEAGSWGVPAGKLKPGETAWECAARELFEETGIAVDLSKIQSLGSLFIRKPDIDYVFHMFRIKVDTRQAVRLSSEHQSYRWVTAKEIVHLPLMAGGREAYERYRSLTKKREGASVNAYLILKQEGKVLLHLRQNTGYCDGLWSLVAGHVEEGESATEGMIREAYEEIGIRPSGLKVVHIMHRKTNRMNVDVFFECTSWDGRVENREPDKCGGLEFFSLNDLPLNIVDYNVLALNAIEQGCFYSEVGWDRKF